MKANGNEIRRRRLLMGLSQQALAKTCKVDVRTIRRAERSESLIPGTLRLIAEALGCNIREIAASEEPVPGPPSALPPDVPEAPALPHGHRALRVPAEQQAIRESIVLIPAAGAVPDGLFTHVTVHCPSLFPVGGKPTIQWQLSWLRDQGFTRFIIAVAEGKEQLEIFLESAFPDLDVRVILDKAGGGVGRTVQRLLEAALEMPSPPLHALVVLGDTIAHFFTHREIDRTRGQAPRSGAVGEALGPVDWNRNWVLYDLVPDTKRWCLFEEDRETGRIIFHEKKDFALEKFDPVMIWKALVGVYYFCNASEALNAVRGLDGSEEYRDRPVEMSYILNRLSGTSIKRFKARFWADVGHPDRLMLAHAALLECHGLKERDFNLVRVDVGRGIIEKTLSSRATDTERLKFIDEIEYYSRLPEPLQIYFPRVVSAQMSWDSPRLVLEYYPYPTLSDLWIYGALDPDVWSRIFEHLREILGEFGTIKRPTDARALEDMYVKKSLDRIERLRRDLDSTANDDRHAAVLRGLLNGEVYTYQREPLPNLATFIRDLPTHARALLQECPTFTVIHGDIGFPNILIQLPSGICKLVDPRGSFGSTNGVYGDPYYDVAKINHSLQGYDFIVNDLFDVKGDGNDLDLNVYYPADHTRVVNRFIGTFLADSEDSFDEGRVRLITGLLFASMMPLHTAPKQQLAMYLTAARLLRNS